VEVDEIEPSTDISFMTGVGAGARFYLSDKLNLDLKGEYFSSPKASYIATDLDNIEYEFTQSWNQFRIKASLNWDI
jgi:hypothetical protein